MRNKGMLFLPQQPLDLHADRFSSRLDRLQDGSSGGSPAVAEVPAGLGEFSLNGGEMEGNLSKCRP